MNTPERKFTKRSTRYLNMSVADALDPVKVPGRVKTFAEMSEDERIEMRRLYET